MAKKLSKRLRKGAGRLANSEMARNVIEKLITAALLAAAVKIRDSATVRRAAEAARAKAEELLDEAGKAGAKRGQKKQRARR